jgi:MFS family permease
MAAAALVGLSLEKWSFHFVLPVVAAFTLIGPLFFYLRIPEPEPSPAPQAARPLASGISILRQDRLFARFSMAFFIAGFGYMMYFPLIPMLQVDELDITPHWVGWLATISALFAGISFYLWGRVVDKKGAVACAVLSTIGWGLVACGFIAVRSLPGLIPIALLMGLAGSATEVALINVIMQFSPPDRIPRYTAVHYTLVGMRGVAAPLLGGLLAGMMPLRSIFMVCTVLILAGVLLMLQVMKEQVRRDEDSCH